jgi:hypothetical protein
MCDSYFCEKKVCLEYDSQAHNTIIEERERAHEWAELADLHVGGVH